MALVRVYCGVATAEMAPWLTVAVVDDAGRLLDMRHISDDPAGYAYLAALLAERSGGACPVAMDRHEHLVAQLLAAANRPLAIADEMSANDLSERFADDTSYDEMQAPVSQRRAIGLARALQAGALYATAQSPSWDLDELKPVLSAHAAIIAGRQASAVTLREVLRELYPAALRAYLDPAEFIPLKILDAFPEAGLLTASPSSRTRETALVAELTAGGVTDAATAVNAITALRVAIEETRAWNANRLLAPAVAETVRQAVAAVRACDASAAALVGSLVDRLSGAAASNLGTRPQLVHPAAPVSPAVTRRAPQPGPAAEVPASRLAPRASAASAAAAGVSALGVDTVGGPSGYGIPAPRPEPVFPASGGRSSWPSSSRADDFATSDFGAPDFGGSDSGTADSGAQDIATSHFGSAGITAAGYGADPSHSGSSRYEADQRHDSNGSSYRNGSGYDQEASYGSTPSGYGPGGPAHGSSYASGNPGWEQTYGGGSPPSYGPDTLSFSTDPLSAPLENPATTPHLRLVESPTFTDPTPHPPLRVIDGGRQGNGATDDDLLIFSEASAWFTNVDVDGPPTEPMNWTGLADDGWRAAEQLVHPSVGPETHAGLPKRVPQANLVPGSAQAAPRQLRIVRDAKSIAEHTDGYFRGWRRGQEVGGFAVGQRDRAAWEFNREQRAREGAARLS